MTGTAATYKIPPEFKPKIWGAKDLGPWFESREGDPIGEVWFPAGDLLIKFLFTSDKLSVQVHPDDDDARQHENSLGKTEMWHILRADPGAQVALGFKEPISARELIPAAKSGAIMSMLNWIDVQPGDTYFVSPGTVHAIGSGLALCEIQQNSDVTYRLYDYGRKREMHLREAARVAFLGCHPGKAVHRNVGDDVELLAECRYFKTYRAIINQPQRFGPGSAGADARVLVVLGGKGRVNEVDVRPGEVLESSHPFAVEPETHMGSDRLTVLLIA
jgi:mannose-6-phosphate isomerase